MARDVHIFVGDIVRTSYGVGAVDDVNTWRDKISEMGNMQAKDFSDRCRQEAGLEYQKTWAEVFVRIGGRIYRCLAHQITVIEGR